MAFFACLFKRGWHFYFPWIEKDRYSFSFIIIATMGFGKS